MSVLIPVSVMARFRWKVSELGLNSAKEIQIVIANAKIWGFCRLGDANQTED